MVIILLKDDRMCLKYIYCRQRYGSCGSIICDDDSLARWCDICIVLPCVVVLWNDIYHWWGFWFIGIFRMPTWADYVRSALTAASWWCMIGQGIYGFVQMKKCVAPNMIFICSGLLYPVCGWIFVVILTLKMMSERLLFIRNRALFSAENLTENSHFYDVKSARNDVRRKC